MFQLLYTLSPFQYLTIVRAWALHRQSPCPRNAAQLTKLKHSVIAHKKCTSAEEKPQHCVIDPDHCTTVRAKELSSYPGTASLFKSKSCKIIPMLTNWKFPYTIMIHTNQYLKRPWRDPHHEQQASVYTYPRPQWPTYIITSHSPKTHRRYSVFTKIKNARVQHLQNRKALP